MKAIKISLLATALSVTFIAFAKTNAAPPKHITSQWQDTIPYRHYDPNRVYLDPNTGDSIEIWLDPSTHHLLNKRNKSMVTIYVDPMTSDTLYGEGYIVNNMVTVMPNGKYRLDSTKVKIEGNKIKYKEGPSKGKVKVEGDKIKAKDGNDKSKMKKDGDSLKVKKG